MRRLRPVELRPYDYGQAVITEGLWFAEGITSYYDLSLPLLPPAQESSPTMSKLMRKAMSYPFSQQEVLLHARNDRGCLQRL